MALKADHCPVSGRHQSASDIAQRESGEFHVTLPTGCASATPTVDSPFGIVLCDLKQLRIDGGSLAAFMPHLLLNGPQVDPGFHQVGAV
jgi:hypothetical protein|tara:strand:+ start:166 stop:432 length:267 start_codon:yes stop_codon:yes gene_type:complete